MRRDQAVRLESEYRLDLTLRDVVKIALSSIVVGFFMCAFVFLMGFVG